MTSSSSSSTTPVLRDIGEEQGIFMLCCVVVVKILYVVVFLFCVALKSSCAHTELAKKFLTNFKTLGDVDAQEANIMAIDGDHGSLKYMAILVSYWFLFFVFFFFFVFASCCARMRTLSLMRSK